MKKSILLLSLCLGLTSCFKEGYDLDDLDTTMQVTAETLWLPASSTGEILLRKFVKAGEVLRYEQPAEGLEYFALRVNDKDATGRDGKYAITLKLINVGDTHLEMEENSCEKLNLDTLPEFLYDERVVLDLRNPALLMRAENHVPSDIDCDIVMRGYDRNNILLSEYKLGRIHLNAAHTPDGNVQQFYIAEEPSTIMPAWLTAYTYTKGLNLRQLVKQVPDRIEFRAEEVITSHSDMLTLGHPYEVKLNFGVFAPLEFGEQFHMEYNYDTDSFSDDLDVIDDLEVGNVLVEADVISTLPLDVKTIFEARNAQNERIEGLSIVPVHDVKQGQSTHITLQLLTSQAGDNVMNYLSDDLPEQKLDHFNIHATCDAGQNPSRLLTTDMYIKVENLRIGLQNVKFTLEEDDNDNDEENEN